MTPAQKRSAKASAKRHGRTKPGLWENVNASKGRYRKKRTKPKGKTRPGKRSRRSRTKR